MISSTASAVLRISLRDDGERRERGFVFRDPDGDQASQATSEGVIDRVQQAGMILGESAAGQRTAQQPLGCLVDVQRVQVLSEQHQRVVNFVQDGGHQHRNRRPAPPAMARVALRAPGALLIRSGRVFQRHQASRMLPIHQFCGMA